MSDQPQRFGRWSAVPAVVKKRVSYSFYLTTITTLAASGFYFFLQPEIPLFYTLALSEQVLAPKIWLALFPSLSFLITILHMIIIGFLHDLDEQVLRLFAITTITIQSIVLLALIRILSITL